MMRNAGLCWLCLILFYFMFISMQQSNIDQWEWDGGFDWNTQTYCTLCILTFKQTNIIQQYIQDCKSKETLTSLNQ